jgi:YHS domain-containing protein
MVKDPICGMAVDEKTAIKLTKDAKEYSSCSRHCKDKFIKEPFLRINCLLSAVSVFCES